MSWSYYDTGLAHVVKERSIKRLEQAAVSCNQISSEVKAINAFRDAIEAACDQAKGQAIRAEGSGSAWLENGKLKSYSFSAKIEVFDLSEK